MEDLQYISIATRKLVIDGDVHNDLFRPVYITPMLYHLLPWSKEVTYEPFHRLIKGKDYNHPLVIVVNGGWAIMFLDDEVNTCSFISYHSIGNSGLKSSIRVSMIHPISITNSAHLLPVKRIRIHKMGLFKLDTKLDINSFKHMQDPVLIEVLSPVIFDDMTYQGVLIHQSTCFKIRYSYESKT